jgi:beta-glucanase (GH16 family)
MLAGFVALASCDPAETPGAGGAKTLVWSDEFEGNSVDLSKWTFETGNGGSNPGWGNNELEYYRAENASVKSIAGESGRALVITAQQESFGGLPYTSARLRTQGKASWTYGRIEARMKLPEGQGIWPAFWMLGDSISSVGWPQCGEIDIMEMVGGTGLRDKTTYGTAHWDDGGHQYRGGNVTQASKLSAGFHVYSVEWTPRTLTWSLDGAPFFSQAIAAAAFTEFQKPAFLLLNLAVGGTWPGNPDATTVFPQQFWIDWIRVYQ